MAALPRRRYRRAYEPACSVGELTALLAGRCDAVVAVDCARRAVDQARERLQGLRHVTVEHAALPDRFADGPFDLVVLSEFLYYLSGVDLRRVLDGVVERLEPAGEVVAVHRWSPERAEGWDGFNVHEVLVSQPGLVPVLRHEDEGFVLDVLRRADRCGILPP